MIGIEKTRKIFLDNLPKNRDSSIDWKNSVGYKVPFIYYSISGEVEIIDYFYKNNKSTIKIKYKNNTHLLSIGGLKKCQLGALLKVFQMGHKYKIGDVIDDLNNWKIEILEQIRLSNGKHTTKGYRYKCLICDNESTVREFALKKNKGCTKCSDGISYPEKFIISLLSQLKLNYKYQKTFKWSTDIKHENIKLKGKKVYDFYINLLNCIIEIHGRQHYEGGFHYLGGRTLEEEQENDKIKEIIAEDNGIKHYIVIDSRKSELEWMKNNIIRKIDRIFDLSNVDWLKCHEFAITSLIKDVCELWENGIRSINDIMRITKLSESTVRIYLKRGASINLCNYDAKKEKSKGSKKGGKKVVQLTLNGEYIKMWDSLSEADRCVGVANPSISKVCQGKAKTAGGFKWMYVEDYKIQ